jgi:hypothetical protein
LISTSASPALGPSRSTAFTSNGTPAARANAALTFTIIYLPFAFPGIESFTMA